MPQWLRKQLMRAFNKRDRSQVRLLNDCWFFYLKNPGKPLDSRNDKSL
ncbi:cortex morphogenetic protein CmpA [Paenibacillus sp. P96]|uniref:Cortex morphogenetic protein CmpA n=1 Tax=Paenibacillus zeirhizosphaerae TaxID=2987519 RepID=A0ABT9FVZ0_9BACL|nr:cortex morphogenetic protein CmpA [Paenibacillus sp. P96]MDP4098894.1 cortex morphogenetic protein CmpA [Paenibacillus sp. P96]